MAKVGADLMALHAEYQAHLEQTSGQGAAAPAFESSNAIAPTAGGSVVIYTAASGDPEALATDLRALGADKVTAFGRMVSARVPIPAIPRLNRLSSLHLARERGDDGPGPFHPDHARALRVKHEPDGIRPEARRQDAALRPSDPADLHAHRRAAAPIALVSFTCTPHPSHGRREGPRIAISARTHLSIVVTSKRRSSRAGRSRAAAMASGSGAILAWVSATELPCAGGRAETIGLDERCGPAHHLGVGVKQL